MKLVANHPLNNLSPEEYSLLALVGYYTMMEASVEVEISEHWDRFHKLDPEASNYEQKKADHEKAITNAQHRKNTYSEGKKSALESLQIIKNIKFKQLLDEHNKKNT